MTIRRGGQTRGGAQHEVGWQSAAKQRHGPGADYSARLPRWFPSRLNAGRRHRRMCGGEQVAVEQHQLQRHRRRRERQHRFAGARAQRRPRTGVGERHHVPGERIDVARRTDEPGVVLEHEFGGAALGAGDHRQAAGHRLERGVGARIVQRRQHERVGGAVERPWFFLRPEQRDAIARRRARARRSLVAPPRLVAADDEQVAVARQPRERRDGARDALARVAGADEQEYRRRLPAMPSARAPRARCVRNCGENDVAVDGVVDDGQPLLGQAEALADFLAAPSSSCRSPRAAPGSRTGAVPTSSMYR